MPKYYENADGGLFVDPIVANHTGLTEIAKEQFDQIIIDRKTFTPEQELENQRKALKSTRDQALSDLTHTLSDGAIVQVRPKDMPNFNIAIANGRSKDWVLADNSVKNISVEDMQICLVEGIIKGEQIWQEYTDGLKAL